MYKIRETDFKGRKGVLDCSQLAADADLAFYCSQDRFHWPVPHSRDSI